MDNYWTRTDDIKRENGGRNPKYPNCEEEMYALDDHGRFKCPNGDDPDSMVDKIFEEEKAKYRKLRKKKKQ